MFKNFSKLTLRFLNFRFNTSSSRYLTISILQTICSQTPPPHGPRCFLALVFQRLQQNRAAASCAAGQHYPDRTWRKRDISSLPRASSAPGEPSFEHPQASWGPLPARCRVFSKLDSSGEVTSKRITSSNHPVSTPIPMPFWETC